ncbi:MAG: acyl-CoA dehydrogenase [Actinobacteria bacterium]|nr:MAG: acyl-CoA dehydrogenase [Actinomycetota bacterium]
MTLTNTFGLTDEQSMLREAVLDTLARALPQEDVLGFDERKEFPEAAYQALAETGFLAIPFAEEYGGAQGSYKDLAVLMETVGYYYTGVAQAIMTTLIYAGGHVARFASEELKHKLIPEIVAGETKLALAMSEPGTGSDLAGITTSAVKTDGGYLINGAKVWITCAHVADYLVVITRTSKGDRRHDGLTTFLIDAKAPGVTISPLNMLGRRTSHANEVVFENVFVPEGYELSEEGKAWPNLMKALGTERLALAAISAGHCFKITEYAREYAKDRIQFGHPISDYQVIQHKLVDMWIKSEVARQAVYRVADLLDGGESAIEETSMAKIVASENNFEVANIGLQILGGAGYSMEYPMQMYFRDSRVGPIGGGTNEIQRNVLAKRMGL